jgi:hypothetical protein
MKIKLEIELQILCGIDKGLKYDDLYIQAYDLLNNNKWHVLSFH